VEAATRWDVSQSLVLGLAIGLFGLIGFRRGVNRELLFAVGIVLGILLASELSGALEPYVNRFYRLGKFALRGGLTSNDPAAAWQELKDEPLLIRDAQGQRNLSVGVFIATALLFYLLGEGSLPAPGSPILRLLGFLAGCVNGYLIAYYLVPIIFAKPVAVIAMAGGDMRQTLTDADTIARVVLISIIVLIAFGLVSASGARRGR